MPPERVHIIVSGRVQGVGFRFFVLDAARALGLLGRVGNRSDGTVVIDAEGERRALERLIEAVHAGPPASRVTAVTAAWGEPGGGFEGFHID